MQGDQWFSDSKFRRGSAANLDRGKRGKSMELGIRRSKTKDKMGTFGHITQSLYT
jgi:hypothetical protein